MDRDFRSIIAWIIHVINGLGAFAATCFLIWHYFQLNELIHHVPTPHVPAMAQTLSTVLWAMVVGIILVAINFMRLLYLRPTNSLNQDYILSQSGGLNGQGVRIAVEAIKNELKAAAESQLPSLSRCRITVARPTARRVKIMASYVACEGTNIMELSKKLRRILTERFREMVPLGEGVKLEIEIDFESFGGKPSKEVLAEEKKQKEDDSPPPFTGVKYPVDGEV